MPSTRIEPIIIYVNGTPKIIKQVASYKHYMVIYKYMLDHFEYPIENTYLSDEYTFYKFARNQNIRNRQCGRILKTKKELNEFILKT